MWLAQVAPKTRRKLSLLRAYLLIMRNRGVVSFLRSGFRRHTFTARRSASQTLPAQKRPGHLERPRRSLHDVAGNTLRLCSLGLIGISHDGLGHRRASSCLDLMLMHHGSGKQLESTMRVPRM